MKVSADFSLLHMTVFSFWDSCWWCLTGRARYRHGFTSRGSADQKWEWESGVTVSNGAPGLRLWSSTLAAPTENHTESDCLLRSCRGIEKEDEHDPAEAVEIDLAAETDHLTNLGL
ncbi:hypothetical protein PFLUV_G00056100 [Perca fluviatilis]|uniref:Uncharacterized protein n=1 Tax=Perca fluviatilis TaxID=8168 RepID=A0A6A5FCS1_PERFL|nr:hypothetical protein PFLUV_G00056100 [Perca fluviatilis]